MLRELVIDWFFYNQWNPVPESPLPPEKSKMLVTGTNRSHTERVTITPEGFPSHRPVGTDDWRPGVPKAERYASNIFLRRNAAIAQLDRALPSEGKGQRFESPRARQ